MQFLCIGVDGGADDVMQHITKELRYLKNRKIDYTINEINSEGSTSIICALNDGGFIKEKSTDSYKMMKTYISNALADYIIRQYEEKLLVRIINSNYCYFNQAEKKDILHKTIGIIKNDDKALYSRTARIKRRSIIIQRLMDYFDNSNSVILDGFVNFRLKEYIKELEEIVDRAVDVFLIDREYKEFVRLLRYFVEVQEPKSGTIHVIVGENNKYILLDEARREITSECIQEYISETIEGEINYDDLLVSSLISFAPSRIVIHCAERYGNKELMKMLKSVFNGRIIKCKECEICISMHEYKKGPKSPQDTV